MFTADSILARVKQQPFIPLRITMSAGDHYDVFHPDLVLVGRRLLVVGTPSSTNPKFFEQATQLSILHVSALENLPMPEAAAEGNGQVK